MRIGKWLCPAWGYGDLHGTQPLAPAILIGGQEIIRKVAASLKTYGLRDLKIFKKIKRGKNVFV